MNRDYIYYEATMGICSECLKKIPAKIIIKDNAVYLKKNCHEHGEQIELFEEDIEYFLNKRNYDKPSTISKVQTDINKGCPFDCGLCPAHDQHSCIGLIEITNKCDMNCKVCYSDSGTGKFMDICKINNILDFFVESENGEADILQISGGEPTLHPEIIDIIKLAKSKNIKYVMLNTNGLKISKDINFVKALSELKGGFEVYLKFDDLKNQVQLTAINNLMKFKVPVTLVTTVQRNTNYEQLGEFIKFGLKQTGIRGINFQPAAYFGRFENFNRKNRVTLSGIIKKIESQLPELIKKRDIFPLPCDVERVAVTYLLKNSNNKFEPITRKIDIKKNLPLIENTFAFDANRIFKKISSDLLQKSNCCCGNITDDIRKVLPANFEMKSVLDKLKFVDENTFRISITSFIDILNFDIKSMQKECVHILTEDLKKIPFSAYNMFYRK